MSQDPLSPLVQIQSVSLKFGTTHAVSNISADIPAGKMIGLIGPDGAGKTTLLRLIAALLLPTNGTIAVDGFDTRHEQDKIVDIISYMPQRFGLYEDLSVQQNLDLFASIYGITEHEKKETFEKLFDFTRLYPFRDRLAGDLSGGMKQKLGLACALIRKPKLLLLDEPSVGVDPLSRRELWKMVQELLPSGISVIWSTAYLDEAEKCDSVLLLSEGSLLYNGPVGEITKRALNRTFLVKSPSMGYRKLIEDILQQDSVVDATIQGSSIRVVLATDTSSIDMTKLNRDDLLITPTPHRFEDAFIDMLGGAPKEKSLLAERMNNITSGADIVTADRLTKKFGSFTAAHEITFSLRSGEIFGLLGPNGAGKSTTFKMLCGLLKPSSGLGFLNGVDLIASSSEARSHLGYMAQKFSLYGDLTPRQNLTFFAGIYGLHGKTKEDTIEELISIFQLQPHLHHSVNDLSLGYKQRLALACAVMHKPSILFLDEPTSGVDPKARREFWNHINALVQKGLTVLVTTHFMEEAEYCDRLALIYQGKMIASGPPEIVKQQAKGDGDLDLTLEEAFISLIEQYDRIHHGANSAS
ncbi:MAG: ATP-binding cassette domain-containing protein [Chlamydia sp.]